jgi:cell division inhibitor SulA
MSEQLLPVRPPPAAGESIAGYLMRVASENGFKSVSQLCAAAARSGREPLGVLFEWLALTKEARGRVFGVLPRRWFSAPPPLGLSVADFNHSVRRWCPLCLAERQVLDGVWGMKLVCVCQVHGVWLHDTCPRCWEPQRWAGTEILRCHCGTLLSSSEPDAADEAVLRLTRAMQGMPSVWPWLATPQITTAEWHRAVRYLGGFGVAAPPSRPGQPAMLHRMTQSRALISGTARLLDNWPKNFNCMLKAYQPSGSTTASLQRAFSPLYGVLYADLSAGRFQFLRDAFEAHLHEHWWGLVCQRNRRLDRRVVETHPRLGLKQAASAAGIPPSVVRHMVQAELLPLTSAARYGARSSATVHSADIDPLRALCCDAVTLSEAAQRLALPEARVRQFVGAGLIKPLISRGGLSRSARWLFAQQELARLYVRGSSDGMPLRRVLRYAHLTDAELVCLVAAVIDGSFAGGVGHLTEGVPLGQVPVPKDRLRGWLADKRLQEQQGMSIDAAARMLGVKQQVAYCLVKQGLLGSIDGGKLGRRVLSEHLELFEESYISLKELARTSRVSSRALLGRIQVAPASGPAIDGNRQIFFRRLDACGVGTAAQGHG